MFATFDHKRLARRMGTPVLASALAFGALPALAGTVTFEDLGVAFGTQLNPAAGVSVTTGGFVYAPGPNNSSGFNDLHIENMQGVGPANGTTVGGSHDDVVLTKSGGGAFSISLFDYAGFPGGEVAFTVVGLRGDNSTISQVFTPDGISDGIGGAADFQTFALVGDWTNLQSVTWSVNASGVSGLFYLDNIVVDATATVPEPGTLALVGLALAGAAVLRRR